MQLPAILEGESFRRLIQGAVVGGLATMFIGFNWGGWMLERTSREMSVKDTSAALIAVLAPICADRFRNASDATQIMAELKKISSWQQDSYIQKGGWATFVGMSSPEPRDRSGVRQVTDGLARATSSHELSVLQAIAEQRHHAPNSSACADCSCAPSVCSWRLGAMTSV